MFGRKDKREQSVAALVRAAEAAEAALAVTDGSAPGLGAVELDLARALAEVPRDLFAAQPDPELEHLIRRGRRLEKEVRERRRADALAEIARRIPPCPCCGGDEVYAADGASIEGVIVRGHPVWLPLTIAICRACGDVRWRVTDPGLPGGLRQGRDPVFQLIAATARREGPYR